MNNTLLAAAAAMLLAACTAVSPTRDAGAGVPALIKAPETERYAFTLAATGVQIYECRVTDGKPSWAFVAPEADLFEGGRKVGTHYAGPTWQLADGSRVVASVKSRADAPNATSDIPWLLLAAKSTGEAGRLAATTSIQRVKTAGGVAPAEGCTASDAGKRARVPYTADYVYFVAK